METDLIGRKLGPYEIVELIGTGGMAEVYRGYHPELDRDVAIKIIGRGMSSDPAFNTRFKREAKAIARLRHPNIVQVYDFGVAEGGHYMVMEYVANGYTLGHYLSEVNAGQRQLFPDDITFLVRQIGSALDHAHENGVIHRDVKPGNIMLTRNRQAILTDFGLALLHSRQSEDQSSGSAFGTPEYMAPEQVSDSRAAGPYSDLYSLGIIIYEMLTGQRPFDADSAIDTALQRLSTSVPDPRLLDPNIPDAVVAVLMRCLDKSPRNRFRSGMLLAAALEQAYKRPYDENFIAALQEDTISSGVASVEVESESTETDPAVEPTQVHVNRGLSDAERRQEKMRLEAEHRRLQRQEKRERVQARRQQRSQQRQKFVKRYGQLFATMLIVLTVILSVLGILTYVGVLNIEFDPAEQLAFIDDIGLETATPTLTPTVTNTPQPTATATATPLSPVTVTPVDPLSFASLDVGSSAYRIYDGSAMQFIPGGQFLMGTADARRNLTEQPQHPVQLSPYWIDRTEVTNRQYKLCVLDGFCELPDNLIYYDDQLLANYPVMYVSHGDAVTYCLWLASQTELVIGLPTEAQWEKAAGWDPVAAVHRLYPWGDTYPTPSEMRFIESPARVAAAPVGAHPLGASAYGVLDMGGNAWEWVADWYDPQYYQRTGISVDPTGPLTGSFRVTRGGSWTRAAELAITTVRNPIVPTTSSNEIGFRCALNAERPLAESGILITPLEVTSRLASFIRRDAQDEGVNDDTVLSALLAALGDVEKALQAGENEVALSLVRELQAEVTTQSEQGNLSTSFALRFQNGLVWVEEQLDAVVSPSQPTEVPTSEPSSGQEP